MIMRVCEKCNISHDGKYGSGRFCSQKCSRSFSTSSKRKEINEKVSRSFNEKRILIEKACLICSEKFIVVKRKSCKKTCSKSCSGKLRNSSLDLREKLSVARTKAIISGKTNFKSIKCDYKFKNSLIKCDSKIEYACLNYFETVYDAISMKRCNEFIEFEDNGQKRRFIPDFIIETNEDVFIVECKSFVSIKSLNEKWRKYNELSLKKKVILVEYANSTNRKSFWFTKDLHLKFYKNCSVT